MVIVDKNTVRTEPEDIVLGKDGRIKVDLPSGGIKDIHGNKVCSEWNQPVSTPTEDILQVKQEFDRLGKPI